MDIPVPQALHLVIQRETVSIFFDVCLFLNEIHGGSFLLCMNTFDWPSLTSLTLGRVSTFAVGSLCLCTLPCGEAWFLN